MTISDQNDIKLHAHFLTDGAGNSPAPKKKLKSRKRKKGKRCEGVEQVEEEEEEVPAVKEVQNFSIDDHGGAEQSGRQQPDCHLGSNSISYLRVIRPG